QAPAGLLGGRAQRVEDRAAWLVDRDEGRVVGQSTLQPEAVWRGGPCETRQKHDDGETNDQLRCAHGDLPSPESTVERVPYFTVACEPARARRIRERAAAVEPSRAEAQMLAGTSATNTPRPVDHLARSATAPPSHARRAVGSTITTRSVTSVARPTSAAASPVKTRRRSRASIASRYRRRAPARNSAEGAGAGGARSRSMSRASSFESRLMRWIRLPASS